MSVPRQPKLARRARLRHDALTGGDVLLYPERGLALSTSASEILALCDGTRSVEDIVATLHGRHPEATPETLGRDVDRLLEAMASRRLVEDAS